MAVENVMTNVISNVFTQSLVLDVAKKIHPKMADKGTQMPIIIYLK